MNAKGIPAPACVKRGRVGGEAAGSGAQADAPRQRPPGGRQYALEMSAVQAVEPARLEPRDAGFVRLGSRADPLGLRAGITRPARSR